LYLERVICQSGAAAAAAATATTINIYLQRCDFNVTTFATGLGLTREFSFFFLNFFCTFCEVSQGMGVRIIPLKFYDRAILIKKTKEYMPMMKKKKPYRNRERERERESE